jgi:acetylornithine deacetylase/succinyl-diaminopimelate desuccinylase-like protein
MATEEVLQYLDEDFPRFLEMLKGWVRIPSVSAPGFDPQAMRTSADYIAEVFREMGLETTILEASGNHPYVLASLEVDPKRPTVLLYGHHDVQPPGREEKWASPAFEPTLRDDGRLYGRGVVDDKAGVILHVAAVEAWLRAGGGLPLNVKFLVDGEEEIGSPGLERILEEHRDELRADVLLITDTANFDTGVPALTYRLRGLVLVDVEVRGLRERLHSGMWGGPVPDPVMGMNRMLASLVDAEGRIAVPGILDDVEPPEEWEEEALERLPHDAEAFGRQAGLLEGVEVLGAKDGGIWRRLWFEPSLTISALEASPLEGATNQIVDAARARIGIRTVPRQDPEKVARALEKHLRKHVPWGLQLTVEPGPTAPWWRTEPRGPAIQAAVEALREGYGTEPVFIGCGGSIPFVEPMTRAFPEAPVLLMGLEDPPCRAHAENESLHLGDWRKGMRSAVILYELLARHGHRDG